MKRLFIIWGIGMVLLAACGGGGSATPTNTPPASAQEATAEVTQDTSVVFTSQLGSASFSVSGDIAVTIDTARPEYVFLEGVMRQRLLLNDNEGKYLVWFMMPQTPTEGAHSLEASGREYNEDGVYVAAFTPMLAEESAIFGESVSGTITLDVVGDLLSGSFEFSASNAEGKSVTLTGMFQEVPLVYG